MERREHEELSLGQKIKQYSKASTQAGSKKGLKNFSSCYKGVTRHRRTGRWEAHIWGRSISKNTGKQIYLGGFLSPEEAAEAHDFAAIQLHGDNAKTNFPCSRYSEWLDTIESNPCLEKLPPQLKKAGSVRKTLEFLASQPEGLKQSKLRDQGKPRIKKSRSQSRQFLEDFVMSDEEMEISSSSEVYDSDNSNTSRQDFENGNGMLYDYRGGEGICKPIPIRLGRPLGHGTLPQVGRESDVKHRGDTTFLGRSPAVPRKARSLPHGDLRARQFLKDFATPCHQNVPELFKKRSNSASILSKDLQASDFNTWTRQTDGLEEKFFNGQPILQGHILSTPEDDKQAQLRQNIENVQYLDMSQRQHQFSHSGSQPGLSNGLEAGNTDARPDLAWLSANPDGSIAFGNSIQHSRCLTQEEIQLLTAAGVKFPSNLQAEGQRKSRDTKETSELTQKPPSELRNSEAILHDAMTRNSIPSSALDLAQEMRAQEIFARGQMMHENQDKERPSKGQAGRPTHSNMRRTFDAKRNPNEGLTIAQRIFQTTPSLGNAHLNLPHGSGKKNVESTTPILTPQCDMLAFRSSLECDKNQRRKHRNLAPSPTQKTVFEFQGQKPKFSKHSRTDSSYQNVSDDESAVQALLTLKASVQCSAA